MTRIFRLIAALTLPALVTWGLAGFIILNWDPFTWTEMQRFSLVYMAFIGSLIFVLVTLDFGRRHD